MAFLQEMKNFNKGILRQTETNFTSSDGMTFTEKRDECGNLYKVPTGDITQPFVGDLKPDLQVGEILPELFLGSVDVATDIPTLEKHGITHILDSTSLNLEYFPGKFNYKHVLIFDLPSTDITKYFDECFAFIDAAMANGGHVLVHCMAGISRSSSIVIAYMMKSKGMDFQTAFDHVKSKRSCICPNEGFLSQLKNYQPQ